MLFRRERGIENPTFVRHLQDRLTRSITMDDVQVGVHVRGQERRQHITIHVHVMGANLTRVLPQAGALVAVETLGPKRELAALTIVGPVNHLCPIRRDQERLEHLVRIRRQCVPGAVFHVDCTQLLALVAANIHADNHGASGAAEQRLDAFVAGSHLAPAIAFSLGDEEIGNSAPVIEIGKCRAVDPRRHRLRPKVEYLLRERSKPCISHIHHIQSF